MDEAPRPKSEPTATQQESKPSAVLRNVHSDESERPPSAQQRRAEDEAMSEDDNDGEELDSDPAEPIADFDWEELHKRYHDAMTECHEHEGQLTEEWTQLMNVECFIALGLNETLITFAVLPHLG